MEGEALNALSTASPTDLTDLHARGEALSNNSKAWKL